MTPLPPRALRARGPVLASTLVAAAGLALGACTAGTPTSTVPGTSASGPVVITTLPTRSPGPTTSAPTAAPVRVHISAASWRLPSPLAREALAYQSPDSVLVAGGLVAGDATTSRAYLLSLSTGQAKHVASLGVAVHDTAGALGTGGRPLVIGGGSSTSDDVVQEFDPTAGTWSVVGHLPAVRSDLTAVNVAKRIYVVGGYNGSQVADPAVLASRGGSTWRTVARLRNPVRYPATAALGRTVWVFGGERNGVEVGTVQSIDLATGTSTVAAHLPQPLGHAIAVPVGSRILLCGGRTNAGGLSRLCRWFDPATTTFSRAGKLPWPLADSAAVVAGSTVYLLGGETPALTDRVVQIAVSGGTP